MATEYKLSYTANEIDEKLGKIGSFISNIYDKNVKAIAHRGYSTVAPENTIPAYILAKNNGFNYVECDVTFTSDGVCVLLHDSTINRTSNGGGSISSMTYNDAFQYDFGGWKSAEYAGTKIPSFDEFLLTCKGLGLHPYIEIKNDSGTTQEMVSSIVFSVKKAGMKGNVTYISFNANYLQYIKNVDQTARLGYVVSNITESVISTAMSLKSSTNETFIDANYSSLSATSVQLCIDADIPLEVWTVNTAGQIEAMNPYISGVTSDCIVAGEVLFNKYKVYTQPEVPDEPTEPDEPENPDEPDNPSQTGLVWQEGYITISGAIAQDKANETMYSDFISVSPGEIYVLRNTNSVWKSDWAAASFYATNSDETFVSRVTKANKGQFESMYVEIPSGVAYMRISSRNMVEYSSTAVVKSSLASTITMLLTNLTTDNSSEWVEIGSSYSTLFIPGDGWSISNISISVIMNGVDVTSDVYEDGVINIESVTGAIVIEASATTLCVPDGYELVRELSEEDLTYGARLNLATPYYILNDYKRLSYTAFDIPVEYGYDYKVMYVSDVPTATVGLQCFNENAMNAVENSLTVSNNDKYDPGWKKSGVVVRIPELHNESPLVCMRITFSTKGDGGTTIPEGMIRRVVISRKSI